MIGFANWWVGIPSGGFFLAVLILIAFEIWMLVDIIQNRRVPSSHKIWWIIGMFLVHPFVAMAYFYVSRWTNTYKK